VAPVRRPTLILGNPPYKVALFEQFLARAADLLPDNGRCGFLLGTQMLQTPNTVLRWNETWTLDQRMVPRTLFPRAIRPLVFVMFTKERRTRMLGGFALYRAAAEVSDMRGQIKLLLIDGAGPGRSCWRAVVEWALAQCGGKAKLDELYHAIEPKRPTSNTWWREKVRQTLQRHFRPLERGVWALPEREAA
jgi:adenine-specific DNA-methyltransferase